MDKRTNDIINSILLNEEVQIENIAKSHNVSSRTIKNDVDKINKLFQKEDYVLIEISQEGKLFFNKNYDTRSILSTIYKNSDYYNYKLSPEERKIISIIILLNADDYITIDDIADHIFVSRTTIITDLPDIKEWIEKNNLILFSKPRRGLKIIGYEVDKRKAILTFIYESLNTLGLNKVGKSIFHILLLKEIEQALNIRDLKLIINTAEIKNGLELTDDSYKEILYYLIVIVNRWENEIDIDIKNDNVIKGDPKYYMAEEIIKFISEKYRLPYCSIEAVLLYKEINKKTFIKDYIKPNKNTLKIQMLSTEFVYKISKDLNIVEQFQYDFYNFLINHIESTIARMKQSSKIDNPFKNELKYLYPDIFEIIKKHVQPIEEYAGQIMNEDEIAYIAMHIIAAIERKRHGDSDIKVLLICSTGFGTALFLSAKLKKYFNFNIVNILSAHSLANYNTNEIDIIISTIAIDSLKDKTIVVNPIPTEQDISLIQKAVFNIRQKKDYSRNKLNENVTNGLVSSKTGRQKYLYEILTADNIILDGSAKNWQDAIRKSGNILLEKDYIEERYITAMIENIKENGSYIVFAPNVAVPHASPSDGAKGVHISMLRLKKPVKFNHEKNDPVKFIFCLSALDNRDHLKAFINLLKLISNKDMIKIIEEVDKPKEVINIIKKLEEKILI
ncbi:BglG family transcription antiterminator [Anaerosalibacter massiliensis]|uniref:PTS sugar transporter subunit IIA n=1 Tax=Anaerosalibacter massiliensis TaxID=1347392 RepID=A0A9X2MI54_9FIRM|nr:PTS sugar transporter subunit IIA [Anaerosalibacter massiliensis]MCR2044480.1 PTS sugar transporter subunit IIA [Anaerosalibacter massiliensis]